MATKLVCQRATKSVKTFFNQKAISRCTTATGFRSAVKCKRPQYFKSSAITAAIGRSIAQNSFICTLRPNLTAGAFPRTARGYSVGGGHIGGATYFSHTSIPTSLVVHNVSAVFRGLCLPEKQPWFNRSSPSSNRNFLCKNYRKQEKLQPARRNQRSGSYIDFHLEPTLMSFSQLPNKTSLADKTEQNTVHLNVEGFLDDLSLDISRTIKNLSMIMNDLNNLSRLGDLEITMEKRSILRVHFPGLDYESVEKLCDDIGVVRGVIHQDEETDINGDSQMRFSYPFAPSSPDRNSSLGSLYSEYENKFGDSKDSGDSSRLGKIEDSNEILHGQRFDLQEPREESSLSELEGIEGIYRIIERCDSIRNARASR